MRSATLLIASVTLSACAAGPDYRRPAIALSDHYIETGPAAPADGRWWEQFGDPLLDRLVSAALAGNLDIAAARARLDQARAAARAAGAARLPRGEVTGGAERTHQSLETPVGAVVDSLGLPRDYSLYSADAHAGWELDLFGGLARESEAARADLGGAAAEAAAVRLAIASETVDVYLQLRGLQARLGVATRQAESERHLAALVTKRVAEGLSAERELNRVSGELAGFEARLAPLRAAIAAQIYRLDVLSGRQAGTDPWGLSRPSAIPVPPAPGGDSDPAALLRRRPDIVAAEHRLIAANARVGSAIATYYPRLTLEGLLGFASLGTGNLLTARAFEASGGAALRWRLFDFGRIDAEVAEARGRSAEALAQYRASVLRATGEVETALARLAGARDERFARERELSRLARARDQTRDAYRAGVLSLIEVLDADRAALDASDRLEMARVETARATVAAVRALGGGWNGDG